MFPNYTLPGFSVTAYSRVEVSEYDDFVISRDSSQDVPQIWVEPVFVCRICLKGRSVDANKSGMLLAMERKAHGHDAVTVACWLVRQFGGDGVSDHEADTCKAFFLFWFSLSVECVACAVLSQAALFRKTNFTECGNIDAQSKEFMSD